MIDIKDLDSFEVDRTKSVLKSVVVWGHKGSVISPLFYIQKPKHLTEEEFNYIMDKVEINIVK